MSEPHTNREGMTFEEFWHAAAPAGEQHFGFIRTRYKLRPSELRHARDIYGTYVNLPDGRSVLDNRSANRTHVYGSKTRDPVDVLRRAWQKGEDPSEWRKWAHEQRDRS